MSAGRRDGGEKRDPRPPRMGQALLARTVDPAYREQVLDDIGELYARRRCEYGRLRADLWYWTQVGRELRAAAGGLFEGEEGMGNGMAGRLVHDARFAVRSFASTPAFSLLSGVTLALGIAGATTMFTLVDQVLLRPLPYPDPEELVHVTRSEGGEGELAVSRPDLSDLRDQVEGLEAVAAWQGWGFLDEVDGVRTIRRGGSVTPGFFELLGAEPAAGRFFTGGEGRSEGARLAVLSHAYWQGRFGGDPSVVGRVVPFGNLSYTVVGVAPPDFVDPVLAVLGGNFGWDAPAAWRVLPWETTRGRDNLDVWSVGRLADGVPMERVREEMRVVSARLAAAHPAENEGARFGLVPAREARVGNARGTLLILLGAVTLLLAIACANVANLFLARGTARAPEMAVRTALGAGRGRLVAQLLTEATVFSMAAGAAAVALSWLSIAAVRSVASTWLPRAETLGVDARMVLFGLMLSLATALLFGLAPALHATGARLDRALRQGRGGTSRGAGRLRAGFAVAQLALAVVLLSGMGLVLRSFLELSGEELGIDVDGVLTAEVILDGNVYGTREAQNALVRELVVSLEGMPQVVSAATINALPMSGRVDATNVLSEEDVITVREDPAATARLPRYPVRTVTPGYFQAMGIPLVRGRDFRPSDGPETPLVALVNEALADALYRGGDPLGRRVVVRDTTLRIVGVVGDVRQFGPQRRPEPALYTSYEQETQSWMRGTVHAVLRLRPGPAPPTSEVRQAVAAAGPALTVTDVQLLEEVLDEHLATPRFRLYLAVLFGVLALVLAAVGVGAVVGYAVARRTREYAVRLACGARPEQVLGSIFRSTGVLAATGVALGLAGAALAGRAITDILYQVPPVDPVVYGVVAVTLAGAALLATVPPARRALGIEPARILREE